MLSTEIAWFEVFAGIFLFVLMVGNIYLSRYCYDAVQFVLKANKNSVSLRQIAELDATVTELKDGYDALLASNKKLRSRIGMRALRDAKNSHERHEIPDSRTDPAGYKAAMRLKLRQTGALK